MTSNSQYKFFDRKPPIVDAREEILSGLSSKPKRLSPKYFYDEVGSKLFDQITELPEYYPTNTEIGLLKKHRNEVAEIVGEEATLIEYGGGSSLKVRLLLERLRPSSYIPVDISRDHLEGSARQLFEDYPWLSVYPTSADYSEPFELPSLAANSRRLAFFPGSSIGNFEPEEAEQFLVNVQTVIGSAGNLLVGIDRKKETAILESAYNDSQGVTAAFNLNALRHINDQFDGSFKLENFRHVANYNEGLGCIQMFLESTIDQVVRVAGQSFGFRAGERMHTENSYKYAPSEFVALAQRANFDVERAWTDERDWFSLFLLTAR
jgi:dimethylhistidine N-methyltransferase